MCLEIKVILHNSPFNFGRSVCLRYSWWIPITPITYGCGKTSDLDHLLTCKLGGYLIMTHNYIIDTVANLLREVCHDVKVVS